MYSASNILKMRVDVSVLTRNSTKKNKLNKIKLLVNKYLSLLKWKSNIEHLAEWNKKNFIRNKRIHIEI